jgi:hypothetical protein
MLYGSIEIYDPIKNSWEDENKGLPIMLKAVAAVSCLGKLYVIGGNSYYKKSDKIFILNEEIEEYGNENKNEIHVNEDRMILDPGEYEVGGVCQWAELNLRLLRAREHHAAANFQNKIWIAGGLLDKQVGDDYSDLCTRSVEVFDPSSRTMTKGPDMVHTRYDAKLVVIKDNLYVIGGNIDKTNVMTGSIEKLNEIKNVWEMITVFPARREKCAIEKIDNYIYIFGGYKPLGVIYNDYDAYDVISNKWLSDKERYDANPNANPYLHNINIDENKINGNCCRNYDNNYHNGNYYSSDRGLFNVSVCKKSLSPYNLNGTIAAAIGI